MAVRVRLTRVGSRKNPIWRVVIADQRSPRDGRVIETVGRYNAQTSPSQIVIDADRVRHWLERGAQPSGTVKKLLRSQGLSATGAPLPGGPRVPNSAGAGAATTHELTGTDTSAPAPAVESDAPEAADPVGAPTGEAPVEPAPQAPVDAAPEPAGDPAAQPPADAAAEPTPEPPVDGAVEPTPEPPVDAAPEPPPGDAPPPE